MLHSPSPSWGMPEAPNGAEPPPHSSHLQSRMLQQYRRVLLWGDSGGAQTRAGVQLPPHEGVTQPSYPMPHIAASWACWVPSRVSAPAPSGPEAENSSAEAEGLRGQPGPLLTRRLQAVSAAPRGFRI